MVAFDPCVEGVQDYGVGEDGVGGGVVGYAVEEVVGFECVECVGGSGLDDVGFEPAECVGCVCAQLALFASETEIALCGARGAEDAKVGSLLHEVGDVSGHGLFIRHVERAGGAVGRRLKPYVEVVLQNGDTCSAARMPVVRAGTPTFQRIPLSLW